MRLVTILLCLLMVFAAVATVAADEKGKPEEGTIEYTRGLLNCDNAIPIACGVPVQGSNAGIASRVTNYSCAVYSEPGGEVVYVLTLAGPNHWNLTTAFSNYTGDPDAFLCTACDEATCIMFGDTTGSISDLLPGTYYLVVDSFGTASATWTLTVTCAEITPPCCPFPLVCNFIDFNETDGGFTKILCGGGVTCWQWGAQTITPPPTITCDNVPLTRCLATVLNGSYPINAGEIAMVGPFGVTQECFCLELCHWHDTEANFDGGNVKISTDAGQTWTLVTPARGYDGTANTSPKCVLSQPVFSGHTHTGAWMRDCFDLTQFLGQQVWVGFHFGSDSSVTYPGWYIKWVKLGGYPISPVEEKSWGSIKALYR